jgi:hypothetical protein
MKVLNILLASTDCSYTPIYSMLTMEFGVGFQWKCKEVLNEIEGLVFVDLHLALCPKVTVRCTVCKAFCQCHQQGRLPSHMMEPSTVCHPSNHTPSVQSYPKAIHRSIWNGIDNQTKAFPRERHRAPPYTGLGPFILADV